MSAAMLSGFGAAFLAASWLLAFILPGARLFAAALLVTGAVLLAVSVTTSFSKLRRAAGSRRGRTRLGAATTAALFAGVMFLVNAISLNLNGRFDLTGSAQFTLTEETKSVLQGIEQPVEVIAFFSRRVPALKTYATNLLGEYSIASDQLVVSQADPDVSPDLARRFGLSEAEALQGAVVFVGPSGRRTVTADQIAGAAEHAFTAAILETTGTRQKVVYFAGAEAFAKAADALRDSLYSVRILDLSAAEVPEDAAAVVALGRGLATKAEVDKIAAFADGGGRLLLLLDPGPSEVLDAMLRQWKVEVGPGMIVDPAGYAVPSPSSLLVSRDRNAFGLRQLLLPGVALVRPLPDMPADQAVAGLAWSSSAAKIESGTGGDLAEPSLSRSSAPLPLGLLLSPSVEQARSGAKRLIVLGDSDFAGDAHLDEASNRELLVMSVNWLTFGKEVVTVERKVLPNRRFLLTPEQARFLNVSSVALLPGLVLLVGAFVWWQRKSA